jgi:hypothetical protein
MVVASSRHFKIELIDKIISMIIVEEKMFAHVHN